MEQPHQSFEAFLNVVRPELSWLLRHSKVTQDQAENPCCIPRIPSETIDLQSDALAGSEEYRETKWFYERARGQYPDERSRRTIAERKKFDLEYPRKQYFTKTDLAKFENSWAGMPEWVSRGAQKNFAEFAKTIGKRWTNSEVEFGEIWFKRMIAKAIIFKALERLVPMQPWYEGGYRANIVTYSMAKVAHDACEMEQIVDLDVVWRAQSIPKGLEDALVSAAAEAHDVITNPPEGIRNMSEWAKKQACWATLQARELTYSPSFPRMPD